eukprot:TRINITY_DN5272_c0_g1_i2.p1 TRINITY_DN5272_c0_g1~~TRINITY_DN5272_c0_g1_i2.p1  ORF type:complete len:291 (-),score=99.82 TRINITY_DN5272_c0_g1_i2:135-1007(-)
MGLEDTIENYRVIVDNSKGVAQELEQKVKESESKCNKLEQELEKTQQELTHTKTQNEEVEKNLAEYKESCTELAKKYKDMLSEVKNALKCKEELDAIKSTISSSLPPLNESLAKSLGAILEKHQTQINKLISENENEAKELEAIRSELIVKVGVQEDEKKELEGRLQRQIEELKTAISVKDQEMARMGGEFQKNLMESEDVQELVAKMQQVESDSAEKDRQLEEMYNKLVVLEESNSDEKIKKATENLQQMLEESEKRNEDISIKYEETQTEYLSSYIIDWISCRRSIWI